MSISVATACPAARISTGSSSSISVAADSTEWMWGVGLECTHTVENFGICVRHTIVSLTAYFFCVPRRQILCSHRSCPKIAADVPESHIGLYEFVCAARRSKRRSFDTKRPSGAYKFKRIYIGLRPSYLARCSPISYPKRWLSHRKNLYISVDFDILCNF
jgi:hypothetical protein